MPFFGPISLRTCSANPTESWMNPPESVTRRRRLFSADAVVPTAARTAIANSQRRGCIRKLLVGYRRGNVIKRTHAKPQRREENQLVFLRAFAALRAFVLIPDGHKLQFSFRGHRLASVEDCGPDGHGARKRSACVLGESQCQRPF